MTPTDDYMFSRWDPLNPTNILAAILLGWALAVYHRPHLAEQYPSYSAFDDLMPWSLWGWAALVIALAMVLTPREGGWRVLSHALCAVYLTGVSTYFGFGLNGLSPNTNGYAVLTLVSLVLFARSAVRWFRRRHWWNTLIEHPPRWLRWLARVGEYAPKEEGQSGH